MTIINKTVARVLIVTMTSVSLPAMQAHAEIVPTEQAIAQHSQTGNRARVEAMFAREEVRSMLEKRGVDYEQAKSRIASLSDDEVATLAGKMDSLPAGGDGFFGTIVFIFFVLLVTDILGFTKVYPFTRSIK